MPDQDSNEENTALAIRSAHQLSARTSLVSRGLKEIAEGFESAYDTSVMDRATVLLHDGKFDEAISVCTEGLAADPNDDILLQIKAVSLANQGKYTEGLPLLIKALEINDTNPHCWHLAARFCNHLRDPEEELKCWHRVVAIDPDHKGAWKGIGDCLFTLGRYQEAAEAFASELRLNPSDEYCQSRREDADAALLGEESDEWTPT